LEPKNACPKQKRATKVFRKKRSKKKKKESIKKSSFGSVKLVGRKKKGNLRRVSDSVRAGLGRKGERVGGELVMPKVSNGKQIKKKKKKKSRRTTQRERQGQQTAERRKKVKKARMTTNKPMPRGGTNPQKTQEDKEGQGETRGGPETRTVKSGRGKNTPEEGGQKNPREKESKRRRQNTKSSEEGDTNNNSSNSLGWIKPGPKILPTDPSSHLAKPLLSNRGGLKKQNEIALAAEVTRGAHCEQCLGRWMNEDRPTRGERHDTEKTPVTR